MSRRPNNQRCHSMYSSIMGAVTNWEAPIYLELLSQYNTTIDNLNIGAAVRVKSYGIHLQSAHMV